jgi:hypothetical protein
MENFTTNIDTAQAHLNNGGDVKVVSDTSYSSERRNQGDDTKVVKAGEKLEWAFLDSYHLIDGSPNMSKRDLRRAKAEADKLLPYNMKNGAGLLYPTDDAIRAVIEGALTTLYIELGATPNLVKVNVDQTDTGRPRLTYSVDHHDMKLYMFQDTRNTGEMTMVLYDLLVEFGQFKA